MINHDDERHWLRSVSIFTSINAVAAVIMTFGLMATNWLLLNSLDSLAAVERQLELRNRQGQQALVELARRNELGEEQVRLLQQAVQRLERQP